MLEFQLVFKPEQVKALTLQAERAGLPLPERIANRPILDESLLFFLSAFWTLSSCRNQDGPIPFTAIVQYADFYECGEELSNDLVEYVTLLDAVFLKDVERRKEKMK